MVFVKSDFLKYVFQRLSTVSAKALPPKSVKYHSYEVLSGVVVQ